MRAFLGGRVFESDATAVLVDGDGRIAAVASDDEVRARMTKDTETVGLAGGFVVPGFQDAHVHLCQAGRFLVRPDLGGARGVRDVLDAAARARAEKREGTLLLEGFDESTWPERRMPLRAELDRVECDRPLLLRRVCCHVAVANGAALARIPEGTPNVDRETGRLEEAVVFRLETDFFPPTEEEDRAAILRAEELAFSLGVTTVHEIDAPRVGRVYQSLARARRLRIRVFFYAHASPDDAAALRDDGAWENFRTAGVKAFLDGSIGGRTAAVRAPYPGGGDGLLLMNEEEIVLILGEAEARGLPLVAHAIGDRAIEALLAAHERARSRGPTSLPHRIEHAEMLGDDQAERADRLGLRLSMQPNFSQRWGGAGGLYEQRLGPSRAAALNRIGRWARRGLPLAFGSDGMPFDPFYGLRGAAEHPAPEERLAPDEALRLYTSSAESFVLNGGDGGGIAAGRRADFNVFAPPAEAGRLLRREELVMTVAAGEVVHER